MADFAFNTNDEVTLKTLMEAYVYNIEKANITIPVTPKYSMLELASKGICLSNVYVAKSNIPLAGRGLFAKETFAKGKIVTVSPVLPIKLDFLLEFPESDLMMNYVFSYPGSEVALFPIGIAAMKNHNIEDNFSFEDDGFISLIMSRWNGLIGQNMVTIRAKMEERVDIHRMPMTSLSTPYTTSPRPFRST